MIELIIYIALVSIFISGAILFSWDIIYGSKKSEVHREVNQNMRYISKRISYEIRNASAINSVSSSDLCLASDDSNYNPTRIYLSGGNLHIAWGGGSSDCTGMVNDEILNSNVVSTTSLSFTDLSSGTDSYNVGFSFTVESSGVRQEWQRTESYSGAVELRSN